MPQPPYTLTAADIADLRVWAKSCGTGNEDGFPAVPVPYLVCSSSDGSLHLHSQGRTVASGLRSEVMCALLYNEKLEPGFCRAVCDPTLTILEALNTPAARQSAKSRILARNAADKAEAVARAATSKRRASQLNPLAMSLDMLEGL